MAAQTPGNYILDQVSLFNKEKERNYILTCCQCLLSTLQCNVLFSARGYKLQLFAGFRRKVSVVFPPADEWKRRLSEHQRRDSELIPETALLKLQRLLTF